MVSRVLLGFLPNNALLNVFSNFTNLIKKNGPNVKIYVALNK